ncbi:MAG: hypothetical protein ACK5NF_06710 [Bacilli bacterium]
MKYCKKNGLIAIIISVIMLLSLKIYETTFNDSMYNKDFGYIHNINQVNDIYVSLDYFGNDLEKMGFHNIGNTLYERAYNKYLCEKVNIDDNRVKYMISDSCLNIYEREIKVDFNNDGYNMIYYLDSEGKYSYLQLISSKDVKFVKYNLVDFTYEVIGKDVDQSEVLRYNSAYNAFITEINALVF